MLKKAPPVEHIIEQPLTDEVTQILKNLGHPNPTAWLDGIRPEAFDEDFRLQRGAVNRQLRGILGRLEQDTTNIRFCIVDDGSRDDWVRLFAAQVGPYMVRCGC